MNGSTDAETAAISSPITATPYTRSGACWPTTVFPRMRTPAATLANRPASSLARRMERFETRLSGPVLLRPKLFGDERGFFAETYRRAAYTEAGIPEEMVQDNHSRSSANVVCGMHFQIGAGAAKLVRCARGAIFDVIVDLRKGSPTYGEWEGFEL